MHMHAPRSWQDQPRVSPGRGAHRPSTFTASGNTEETIRVPVHAVPIEKAPLASLPVRIRQVFLLSNGQRTPQEIAQVLRLPLNDVERFIQILHKKNLMIWQRRAS